MTKLGEPAHAGIVDLDDFGDVEPTAAKAVSEDKRQSVTITSVKMVGGVAPEAELMRQATEQLEGMGFRVEHPKAVQPQAQGEACEHGTSWDTVCRRCDDEAMSYHPYDHPDVRDLRKWLNEGQTREIDRHVLARVLAMLAHPQASEPQAQGEAARLWCETCEGGGTVDNTLGGDNINSTSHDKCPDCDGHGYFLSSVYRTRGQQP